MDSVYNDSLIEDLWLDFYCVSTNLGTYSEQVHFSGLKKVFVRASMSICGYTIPVPYKERVLEELDGEYLVLSEKSTLLVDGAYSNNVPVDVMKNLGVENIISVDVTHESFVDLVPYDFTSGTMLFLRKFLGFSNYLTFGQVLEKLAYLTTYSKLKDIKDTDLHIRPELSKFSSKDFDKFDQIVAIGYESAKKAIKEWKKNKLIKKITKDKRNRLRHNTL